MWNPFSKKQDSLQDALYDLNKQLGSPQQGSGTLLPAAHGTFQVPHNHYITQPQLQQWLQQLSVGGLTPEEKVEFDKLTEEYKANLKQSKLTAFKKLPTELRQFVVNFFTWQESINLINAIIVDKSERLKELEQKNDYGRLFSQQVGQYVGSTYTTTGLSQILFQIDIPEDLTAEELKQAHIEASMEEEMLNGEK